MLNIGGNKKRAYLGAKELSKAHLGEVLVYSGMEPFTLTFNIASSPEVLTLPTPTNYLVDWGDGTTSDDNNQHLYTSAGVYTVKMFGAVDDFAFNNLSSSDKDKLLTVENWGEFWFRTGSNFYGCSNLSFCKKISSDVLITSFPRAFQNTPNLDLDISEAIIESSLLQFSFDNSGVNSDIVINSITTDLIRVFRNTNNFNGVISGDTSNVFRFSSFLQNSLSFNNDSLKDLDYSSAEKVDNFMQGKSSADYDYQYYDNLLINWASGAANGGLDFTKLTNLTTNFGTIQYSSAGAAARAFLVSEGLIITDGGNNGL